MRSAKIPVHPAPYRGLRGYFASQMTRYFARQMTRYCTGRMWIANGGHDIPCGDDLNGHDISCPYARRGGRRLRQASASHLAETANGGLSPCGDAPRRPPPARDAGLRPVQEPGLRRLVRPPWLASTVPDRKLLQNMRFLRYERKSGKDSQ